MKKLFTRNTVKMPHGIPDEYQELWRNWEEKYGPYVIGDQFGENDGPQPNLSEIAWCHLYPLGILILESLRGKVPKIQNDRNMPIEIMQSTWGERFWKEMENQTDFFNSFLSDWRLASLFGSSTDRIVILEDNPWQEDQKILGLNIFNSLDELKEYVLLWKKNNSIRNSEAMFHRLVASRGVDLICSELVSNSIEHGLKHGVLGARIPKAFILAKLCNPKSAREALRLHEQRDNLTEHEFQFYSESANSKEPIIQIVIADMGRGFAGNKELVSEFEKYNEKKEQYPEYELIKFALRPDISKNIFARRTAEQWIKYLKHSKKEEPGEAKFRPSIHGLSEINIFIREFGGFWRIHSNDTICDIQYGIPEIKSHIASKRGRKIQGCLHYIMLPLKSKSFERSFFPVSMDASTSSFKILDSAKFIYEDIKTSQDDEKNIIFDGVVKFCKQLTSLSSETLTRPVLINITPFNSISDLELLYGSCAILADTLHRVRENLAIFICGANDKTKLTLASFIDWKESFFNRRVIPFFSLFSKHDRSEVEIVVAEEMGHLKGEIESALSPWNVDQGIFKSRVTEEEWKILEEVAEHNKGIFKIKVSGGGADLEFIGTLKLDVIDATSHRLLIGGRSFEEVQKYIINNRAILFSKKKFKRYAKKLDFYIHIAFLWADTEFKTQLIDWLTVAAKNIQRNLLEKKGKDIVFLAILHPAIEIARTLVRDPEFANADISEVRRISELRWDAPSILKLSTRKNLKVVCLTDFIGTGATVNKLQEALKYIEIDTIGLLSIITLEEGLKLPKEVKRFSFCETPRNNFGELEPIDSLDDCRIIDADSQVTVPYKELEKKWCTLYFDEKLNIKSTRLEDLVNRGYICFSHGAYGDLHHIFYIILKKIKDYSYIVDDIKRTCHKHLGGLPDIILYPGDSTISYIIKNEGNDELFHDNSYIVSPARRAYKDFELRMELSGEHRKQLREAEELKVLLIDDSMNSGKTEQKAKDDFVKTRLRLRKLLPQNDKWLTYVVMRRGKRVVFDKQEGKHKIEFSYHGKCSYPQLQSFIESYCDIGPKSMTAETCPFVPARRRLLETKALINNCRAGITNIIDKLFRLIEGTNIEWSHVSFSLLEKKSVMNLLNLCELDIPIAVTLIENFQNQSKEQIAASLMFSALYYDDVMSYLSIERLHQILLRFTGFVTEDDEASGLALLAALLILPTSISVELCGKLLEQLIVQKSPNTSGAMLAILFAKYDRLTQETISGYFDSGSIRWFKSDSELNEHILHKRKLDMISRISKILEDLKVNPNNELREFAWFISADFMVLSSGFMVDNITTTARKFAALVYPSLRHTSYPWKEVEDATLETFPNVLRNIKRTQACSYALYNHLNLKPGEPFMGFRRYITSLEEKKNDPSITDLIDFKFKAKNWLNTILKYSKISCFFHSPFYLYDNVKSCHDALFIKYSHFKLPKAIYYKIFKIKKEIRKWNCLAPDQEMLKDHFYNMLHNPLKYICGTGIGIEKDKKRQIEELAKCNEPLVCVYFYIDFKKEALMIVFANRSPKIAEEKVFNPSYGLGSAKIRFSFFGGDIHCRVADGGLLDEKMSDFVPDEIKQEIRKPEIYKNLLITQIPLIWETRQ